MSQEAIKFVMHRKRTIASTCGLSIEFEKGVPTLTPPAMFAEVLAAGGVPESEIPEDEAAASGAPSAAADREKAIFEAFEGFKLRNDPNEFTAGGAPHFKALSEKVGFVVQAKERDTMWVKFTQALTT